MFSHEMTQKALISHIQDDIKQRSSQLQGNSVLVYSVSAFYIPKIPTLPNTDVICECFLTNIIWFTFG